jgi:hypothetical protein
MNSSPVPTKIYRIFDRIKTAEYNGTLRCQHFAIVLRRGKPVSPVSCNYLRANVFGKTRGTMHAEMSSLNYVLNKLKSICGYANHKRSYDEEQCLLRPKGLQEAA